ncbi:MAG TPA: hypothetical protein VFV68_11140, partial [Agriterribacter sp.]|nr:hypothetical protein [Agriterribacter sp.]
MKQTIALSFILLISVGATAQNTIGLPEIVSYPKQVYKAGTQNWDICQDKGGLLYFANNEGLLSFDGNYWKLYPLPNKTIVRSVAIADDNKIYVGGQDEMGYFSPDTTGTLKYHTLKNLIPEKNRSFADVWDIVCSENQVLFRSKEQILQLSDNRITIYPADNWLFMGATTHSLIAQDYNKGILLFKNGMWTPIATTNAMPADFLITAVLDAGKDSILITSLKHGVYLYCNNKLTPFQSPDLTTIADYNIYNASVIDNGHIA